MEEMNFVGTEGQESVQTDAVQAPEHSAAALSEMLVGAEEGAVETEPQENETKQQEEAPKMSGGLKGRLLEAEKKGEKRGYDAGRQALQQEYEARLAQMQERLTKLDEYELREEAAKLAKDENISEAIAMRLLRAEKGMKAPEQPKAEEKPAQARDSAGRFTSPQKEEVNTRAQFLYAQAQSIMRRTGVDAIELYKNADSETQSRIARGEIDFEDIVSEAMSSSQRTPPVVKANGGSAGSKRLADMNASDFRKMDEYVMQGGVIDLRK